MESSKKETMLKIIVDYLRKTPPWILMVHIVYIAAVSLVLSTAYVISFHYEGLVRLYEEAHDVSAFSTNLKTSVETQNQISYGLSKAMDELDGMRAYVYRYHNGLAAISGVPFFFQTNTNEVINPGAARLMQFEQRIPVGINMAMNLDFVENRCAVVQDADKNKNDQNYYLWTSRGARAVIRCPIYMPNGDLFGFVGVDFLNDIPDKDKAVDTITALAADIGKLFNSTKP